MSEVEQRVGREWISISLRIHDFIFIHRKLFGKCLKKASFFGQID